MSSAALIRAGGIAAIVGGVLRVAASFAPSIGSDVERQLLYFVIDVFLLLGLLGFYELRHQDIGRTGALGFLLALVGLSVVRSSRAIPGLDLYPVGALAFVGGLIAMCGSAWRVKTLAGWVPVAFVVSTLVGFVGTVVNDAEWLFVVSGLLFGAAFAGLGRAMWFAARRF
ncbi:MAG TPA: hypothetical protein VGQ39_25065 [Pyrinomonadaceae bacterium]|jgi:hypothetical protein|nr:hypothetical protein [Pyrinomonadaceae bacterium]